MRRQACGRLVEIQTASKLEDNPVSQNQIAIMEPFSAGDRERNTIVLKEVLCVDINGSVLIRYQIQGTKASYDFDLLWPAHLCDMQQKLFKVSYLVRLSKKRVN